MVKVGETQLSPTSKFVKIVALTINILKIVKKHGKQLKRKLEKVNFHQGPLRSNSGS